MTVTEMTPRRPRARRPARAEVEALQALTSQADQIRYACEHMPAPTTPERLRSWLGERDVEIKTREHVSRTMNKWKAANGQPVTPAHGLRLSDIGTTTDTEPVTPEVTAPVTPEDTPEGTETVTAHVTSTRPEPTIMRDLQATPDGPRPVTAPVTPEGTAPVTRPVTAPVTAPDVIDVRSHAPMVTTDHVPVTRDLQPAPPAPEVVTVTVTPQSTPEVTPDVTAHRASARTELIGNAALVVPLLLVNTVAVYGQVQWAHEHLTPGSRFWFVAVGFALAVESIGVYLAAEAHRALLAGDASLRLRLGSYMVGALAGALNYAHFAPKLDAPNTQAIVFGVLSAISPILWAIRSRSISRDRLRALQLIDGRSVKFTAAQWLLFPRRSARAFRAAVWAGETNPTRARALVDSEVSTLTTTD